LVALLARTSPPGTTMPDEAPWPAMPVLATDPLRLIVTALKLIPLTLGACPTMFDGAAL